MKKKWCFLCRQIFDKKNIGSLSRILKVSVTEGVVSVSNGQVSVSNDEVLVSVSDDEAETPSLFCEGPKCLFRFTHIFWQQYLFYSQIHDNWKYHKPRIASYWLVKLDSIKRRKVIDIVRSNVRAVMQRTWRSADIDTLRLYRIFNRVFNRLLWSHGQGLWNCFSTSG